MSKLIDELRNKWATHSHLANDVARYLLINPTDPQEWFLGWDSNKNKELIFVTRNSSKLSANASSRYIRITEKRVEEHKYLLTFTLVDETVYEVYLKLCEDLIEEVRGVNNNREAQKIILVRFELWKRMLERPARSMVFHKGVLGELLMIRELLDVGIPALEVLGAWTGPEFTEQDFVFHETWYEVKAVTTGAMVVTISSAGQLDHPGDGFLYVYHLDNESSKSSDSLSVKKIIAQLKNEYFIENIDALHAFEDKLYQYEYADLILEDEFWFKYTHRSKFVINEDFPKLTHDMKRVEMQSVKYTLILSALEKWRIQ